MEGRSGDGNRKRVWEIVVNSRSVRVRVIGDFWLMSFRTWKIRVRIWVGSMLDFVFLRSSMSSISIFLSGCLFAFI